MKKNYNLKTCPACDTEYHPSPAFVGWKKRYCSDACEKMAAATQRQKEKL